MQQADASSDETSLLVIIDDMELRRAQIANFLAPWAQSAGLSVLAAPVASLDRQVNGSAESGCRLAVLNIGGVAVDHPETQRSLDGIRAALHDTPTVIISDRDESEEAVAAFRAGVRGFIPTRTEPSVALQALTFILGGGSFFPPAALLHERPAEGAGRPGAGRAAAGWADSRSRGLTARQRQVLELLRQGKPNKLIALELRMQESTVKVHVRQIMRKLGAMNRTQAAICALQEEEQEQERRPQPGSAGVAELHVVAARAAGSV